MRKLLCALGLISCLCLGLLPAGGVSAAGLSGGAVVQYAEQYQGYPYTTVGNSPATGFSCIGFVSYVYRSLGVNLPGDLGGAMAFAAPVAFSNLLPGDVLYFANTVWPGLSHTAIYIGGGRFIHAEWYNRGVVISSFTNDPVDGNYWTEHYLGANRPWASAVASPPAPPAAPTTGNTAPAATSPAPAPVRVRPRGPVALVRVSGLNLRQRPSLNGPIKTVLPLGRRVIVMWHWRSWYRVALPSGARGWLLGAGIGKGAIRSGAVRVRRNTSVHLRPLMRVLGSVTVRVSGLRVHTSPGLSTPVLTTAAAGQHLTVVGRSAGWTEVQIPSGGKGWISNSFVGRPAAASRSQVRRASAVRLPAGPRGVSRLAVNIRQRPSLGASILAVLPPGGVYTAGRWSGGWVYVHLNGGISGWVSASLLQSRAPTHALQTRSVSTVARRAASHSTQPTITAGVRLHFGAGVSSPVKGLVAAGTHVQVLGSRGGWTKVRLPGGGTGYVLGIYVNR